MEKVAVVRTQEACYPNAPFNPPLIYPEYPFTSGTIDKRNYVYEAIRKIFYLLGMDKDNYGEKDWNPLGDIVKPGDHVVIKPNFVTHCHHTDSTIGLDCIITNGSIIRTVIDYIFIATGNEGKITIADSPIDKANFMELISKNGLIDVRNFLDKNNCKIGIINLMTVEKKNFGPDFINHRELSGDPNGYTVIDLGRDSEFNDISKFHDLFRAGDLYSKDRLQAALHHTENKNEYSISKTVLDADVMINLPKLKTHRMAGVTLSLKAMVGITNEKYWLPHYRMGCPPQGDETPIEYPSKIQRRIELQRKIIDTGLAFWVTQAVKILDSLHIKGKIFDFFDIAKDMHGNEKCRRNIFSGGWYGNDTLWRNVIDLNKIIFYADKEGNMKKQRQRKYFSLIDGIIAGEGNGPLNPTPKKSGLLIGGKDPTAVDYAATKMMGIDPHKIKLLTEALKMKDKNFGISSPDEMEIIMGEKIEEEKFMVPFGW